MNENEEKGMVLYDRAASGVAIPNAMNLRALATDLLNSRLYPNIQNATQAIAIIAAGQELGLGPTASLQYISIVNGRMCAEAKVWLALFHRSGGKTKILKRDKESCKIEFSKPGRETYVSEYTQEMAKTEGLWDKANWKKMPETYLQWRAVSNGIRAYDPGVVMGITLTAEEVEDYPSGLPGDAKTPDEVHGPGEPKKGRGRPRAAKPAEPAPEGEEEPKSPAQATPAPETPKPTPKPQPGRPQRLASPPPTDFDLPADDDPLSQAETAETASEEDAVIDALKAALEKEGVDLRSFKEWLIGYQAKMPPQPGGRRFLVRMKNAIRFHGGTPGDHKYLLSLLPQAVAMFRYAAQSSQGEQEG